MKKTSLVLLVMLYVGVAVAQVPQALNYQAIARTSSGQIIPSQNIGIRFSITDVTGNTVFYQETHNTTTNAFGLFTLAIGKGTAVSGTVPNIDWSSGGDKYLKVEIAPQGGTNYTLQGTTQLISVPYSLYAEKTKLVGGTAVTITNGNTINANYQAGPGIIITGNTISSTSSVASWLLNGNTGTTAANFIGTTDDQRLYFRTNNKMRMFLEKSSIGSGSDLALLSLSDEAGSATNPAQLSIWGRELVGMSANMLIANNVVGQTWGEAVGNTQGRMIRFSQMTASNFIQSHFYDLGISRDSSFYISDHWFQNAGANTPRKMITISPQNLVGINLDNAEKPTANFHTKGSVRLQGLTSNNTLTNVLVTDANGNVSTRDASSLGGAIGNDWTLIGNTGTTAANFLGTTDAQPMRVRTNNINRLTIDAGQPITGGNFSITYLSDLASIKTAPAELAVFGKDVSGTGIPVHVFSSVEGMTWSATGGTNNTVGRLMRYNQMTGAASGSFFDVGIDQGTSFFISNKGLNGTAGVFPKKMITISPTDFVGINLNWAEDPTANLHTKGSVRLQGLNTNNTLTNVLVTDANGNVSTRDANTLAGGNGWLLTGNAGTTAANFLGTTDNQSMSVRTNNINRLTIDAGQPITGGNFSITYLSDLASIKSAPAELAVFGKDVSGIGIPVHVFSSVEGMTWSPTGGTNNTVGRLMRLNQMTGASSGSFFDFGIDQGTSFFISNKGLNGTAGVFPKKMFTISPSDFVGINLNWGEDPTANLHTKGSLRFEGINTNNSFTRVLAMDANGNVAARDASTLRTHLVADANGIHNDNRGHVGFGGVSSKQHLLNVEMMENTADGRAITRFASNDTWQTNLRLDNTTTQKAYSIVVGGNDNRFTNYGVGRGNFGIVNGTTQSSASTIPLIITSDNKVGIGNGIGGKDNLPKSRLHVRDGDVFIDDIGSGVIMKSPNGKCWRMTVSNEGTPVFTAIPCPK